MADDELEAIRRQRMAELQAKHGVRTRRELGNVFAAALKGDTERASQAKPDTTNTTTTSLIAPL